MFKFTLTFSIMYLAPLVPKSCAGHNFYTVRDNLMILVGTYIRSRRCVAFKKDNLYSVDFLPK